MLTGIGSFEVLLVFFIAALAIGPDNLKSILEVGARTVRKIRTYTDEVKSELQLKEEIEEIKTEIDTVEDLVREEISPNRIKKK